MASNPYHYDSHVELIKLLRQSGDLDKVRNAREGMSKIFPLTEGKVMFLDTIQSHLQMETCGQTPPDLDGVLPIAENWSKTI